MEKGEGKGGRKRRRKGGGGKAVSNIYVTCLVYSHMSRASMPSLSLSLSFFAPEKARHSERSQHVVLLGVQYARKSST